MSRYIDAEALKEEFTCKGDEWINNIIDNEPTIDAVSVVRCKECRHWIGETEYYEDREYKACWQLCGQYMDSEFWCKYGERESE